MKKQKLEKMATPFHHSPGETSTPIIFGAFVFSAAENQAGSILKPTQCRPPK